MGAEATMTLQKVNAKSILNPLILTGFEREKNLFARRRTTQKRAL